MNKKLVIFVVVVLLAFGAATHPAAAGQLVHDGFIHLRSVPGNVKRFVTSVKGGG
jgi:hypothetical protein